MNNYHEFKHAHEIQIEKWQLYWSPNYVSMIRKIVAPSGAMITSNISLTNEGRNVSGNRTTRSGGTIGVVV